MTPEPLLTWLYVPGDRPEVVAGLTMRQGPHQVAHRSRTTGTVACSTISVKSASPASAIQGRGCLLLNVYRIARELGSLAAAMEGIDAIVFTAGIGEHAAAIREGVMRRAAWLGVEIDVDANNSGGPLVTTASSRVPVWVIPTNEEWMIAQHTRRLIR